jgi:hypothetical protein
MTCSSPSSVNERFDSPPWPAFNSRQSIRAHARNTSSAARRTLARLPVSHSTMLTCWPVYTVCSPRTSVCVYRVLRPSTNQRTFLLCFCYGTTNTHLRLVRTTCVRTPHRFLYLHKCHSAATQIVLPDVAPVITYVLPDKSYVEMSKRPLVRRKNSRVRNNKMPTTTIMYMGHICRTVYMYFQICNLIEYLCKVPSTKVTAATASRPMITVLIDTATNQYT